MQVYKHVVSEPMSFFGVHNQTHVHMIAHTHLSPFTIIISSHSTSDPDLAQHSARIRNRRRFDEAGCHELEERVVVDDIEAETPPGSSDDLDQPAGPFPGDRRCRAGGAEVEVEFLLAGDVFSRDQIESYIELKWNEVYKFEHTPHPVEFEMYYSV